MTVTARIAFVDFENNAEDFWTAFRARVALLDQDTDLANNCRKILTRDEVELLNAAALADFHAFVTSIPGFYGGQPHAPTAICFDPNMTHWRDLNATNGPGSTVKLGEYLDAAARGECEIGDITLNDYGSIIEWAGVMISADGEDPDWNTPRATVDWTGFVDAVNAVRNR